MNVFGPNSEYRFDVGVYFTTEKVINKKKKMFRRLLD